MYSNCQESNSSLPNCETLVVCWDHEIFTFQNCAIVVRMLSAVREAILDRCGQEKDQWSVRGLLHKWLPITRWLPKYNPKKDLPGDIAAGLTLGIMNIPQGKWNHCFLFSLLSSCSNFTISKILFLEIYYRRLYRRFIHLTIHTKHSYQYVIWVYIRPVKNSFNLCRRPKTP